MRSFGAVSYRFLPHRAVSIWFHALPLAIVVPRAYGLPSPLLPTASIGD